MTLLRQLPQQQDPLDVGQPINPVACTNCALFQGKASDAWGGGPLFGSRQVAGKGWCNAWAKKG